MTQSSLSIDRLTDELTTLILEEMLAGGFETSHDVSVKIEEKLREHCEEVVSPECQQFVD